MFGVTDEIPDVTRNSGMVRRKINILDEGYWSPELFWRYQVMTTVSERGFGGPDKRWGPYGPRGEGTSAH